MLCIRDRKLDLLGTRSGNSVYSAITRERTRMRFQKMRRIARDCVLLTHTGSRGSRALSPKP